LSLSSIWIEGGKGGKKGERKKEGRGRKHGFCPHFISSLTFLGRKVKGKKKKIQEKKGREKENKKNYVGSSRPGNP